jgi:hypothetical protein
VQQGNAHGKALLCRVLPHRAHGKDFPPNSPVAREKKKKQKIGFAVCNKEMHTAKLFYAVYYYIGHTAKISRQIRPSRGN